jgi:integrase/recombinase XerD
VLSAYLLWARVERGLSPSTLEAYRRELENLSSSDHAVLEALGTEDLRAYIQSRGGKASTVARRIAALRSFFGWLQRQDHREDDPSRRLDRPRVKRGLPRPIGNVDDALERLDPVSRNAAVLLNETGLRISELCSLSVPMPPPEELVVNGKGGKERVIPLSDQAWAALSELGGKIPISKRSLQRRFQDAGFTAHRLRHTFATELAEADVDLSVIQDLLGHRSPATTRIYLRNDARRLRAGIEKRRSQMATPV